MSDSRTSLRHRFGLNYVPSKRWYFCWNDWHRNEIAEDMEAMASIGIDHIRVQLIWSFFQPNPTYVSKVHLARLQELMGMALDRGIDVVLCPLTGWLSGYRFLPPDTSGEDVFCKPETQIQIQRYLAEIVAATNKCDNLIGFDLGNEINVLGPMVSQSQGDSWGNSVVALLKKLAPDKMVLNGVDHQPWFNGQTFSIDHLVDAYDALCIHAWPAYTGCLEQHGLADCPSTHLSAFMTRLVRQMSILRGVNKPIWIQEFGCSALWGDPEEQASYLKNSVDFAVEAGATWFTWWCSHDIDRALQFDQNEYNMGLLTTDNRPKPLAEVFGKLIESHRDRPPVESSLPSSISSLGLEYEADLTGNLPRTNFPANDQTTTWQVFQHYLNECRNS